MSFAYHSQIDGQTEVVNKSLEHYLRAFAANKPHSQVEWLPLVEYWFNFNFHTSTKLTPFEALYGYSPPRLLDYMPGTTKVEAVDAQLKSRQELFSLLRFNLVSAQERMKFHVDKHRSERSFSVGDCVYLRLQTFKQEFKSYRTFSKLSTRFFGPFQVLQKVGAVAYKLHQPSGSQIHPIFHVSCLKAKLAQQVTPCTTLPAVNSEGILNPEPIAVPSSQEQNCHTCPYSMAKGS